MKPYAIMQSWPVFVTGTFREMHAEWDYLHNVVLPELEEHLKVSFHHLEPIDLHQRLETWNLAEPHAIFGRRR